MNQEYSLKATPLLEVHKELGARIVPFSGWQMPIQYSGLIQEHLCVRNAVGLFDVSHMGEIDVKGPEAFKFIQKLITNDAEKMDNGSIIYSVICYENGGVVDDLLVHKFSDEHYFLCVNAGNVDKDFEWISEQAKSMDVEVVNTSDSIAQLAIQGRHAQALLQKLSDVSLDGLEYYRFIEGKIHSVDSIISRTGYTGEDGFEIYFDAEQAVTVFKKIIEEGKPFELEPIGLGARDTLRLEMGYSLYGQEISENINPLEAGLSWVVKLNKKENFIGKEAIQNFKDAGVKRRLAGVKLMERGVPRSHYPVLCNGDSVGEVTSGTFSPSLNCGVALCSVSSEYSKVGTKLDIQIRGKNVPGEVVKLPFVESRVKK
jgi:aminomethyltransferase